MEPVGNEPAGPDAVTVIRLPLPHAGADPVRLIVNRAGAVDLGLADRLHDGGAPRPYSVAQNGQTLDVICFADELARALLASGDGARICTRRRHDEIIPTASEGRVARLAFLSPAHFRVAGLDYLLPDPFHLLGGLVERWQELGWPALAWPNLKRVAVSLAWLRAAEHPTNGGQARRGFVGLASYDLLPLSDDDQEAVWRLLRFAEWRGVGAHTSYGMGRVRILGPGQRVEEARPVWADREGQ